MEVLRSSLGFLPRTALVAGGRSYRCECMILQPIDVPHFRTLRRCQGLQRCTRRRRLLAPKRPPPYFRCPHCCYSQSWSLQLALVVRRYADVLSSAVATCRKLESGAAAQPGGAASGAVTMDNGPRVALMADPGPAYVAGAFGTWMHGGIAVPLCLSHPDRWACMALGCLHLADPGLQHAAWQHPPPASAGEQAVATCTGAYC